MRYAFAYGADAVYAGLPRYSLRVRNNRFVDTPTLASAIAEARALGKRFYLAANILAHGAKLRGFIADLEPILALAPDALIMADPGLILMVRERWPNQAIHLSVQANTTNAAAVRFWAAQGIRRVILSRELSLDEIAEIRAACPDVELEVFVHGALCIAYSGRCLLSGYFNHRDANQGACTNACRWDYRVAGLAPADALDGSADPATRDPDAPERHPAADAVYLLEERERPGAYLPIFEDAQGTYILNSRDLRAIEHVARLRAIGVDALKIEGRTKSLYYVARAVQAYRTAIDDARAGRPFRRMLLEDLEGLANRGYTEGFYRRHAPSELQNYADGASRNQRQIFVGEIIGHRDGWAEVQVKNRFAVGDTLEIMAPAGNHRFQLEAMRDLEGGTLQEAPGDGWVVRIPLQMAPDSMALLTRLLIEH